MSRDEIWAEAMKLPAEERWALAQDLMGATEFDPDVAEAWEDEIARRLDDMDAGRVNLVPAKEVFEALRQQSRALRARRGG